MSYMLISHAVHEVQIDTCDSCGTARVYHYRDTVTVTYCDCDSSSFCHYPSHVVVWQHLFHYTGLGSTSLHHVLVAVEFRIQSGRCFTSMLSFKLNACSNREPIADPALWCCQPEVRIAGCNISIDGWRAERRFRCECLRTRR